MIDEPHELFDQEAVEPEVLDGVPVLTEAQARPIEARRSAGALSPAALQTVAVLGASVVAGAAAAALVQRRSARRLARRRRSLGPVLGSRSFLVDVHVLGERK